jgi:two-component system, chemotaxis family, chemotaxis protein CheY
MQNNFFPYETKILLIEDTEITRKIIHRMLYKMGYTNVVEAENGVVAWAEIEKSMRLGKPFQLIVADWKMPGMSGLELLRKVRGDHRVSGTPFLLLTTNTRKDQVLEAITAGVNNYLAKPFVIEVFEKKLKETWEQLTRKAS